eukprot:comp14647_c0_seq1/m.10981 comp14647_c0_seq1/g.10981  ORF comp14647_c0_seq1/g.10981 comp14647_c0_seq1/m.10981 type:complete len:378 (-) comp14647_c0_seq1:208-1341(-)
MNTFTVLELKVISIAGTFITGLAGLLVFPLRKVEEAKLSIYISYINAFGSGVMIAVGLLHMLAESNKDLSEHYEYPIAFLLAGVGFAMVYVCEDVILAELVGCYGSEIQESGLPVHTHGAAVHHVHEHRPSVVSAHGHAHLGTHGSNLSLTHSHSHPTLTDGNENLQRRLSSVGEASNGARDENQNGGNDESRPLLFKLPEVDESEHGHGHSHGHTHGHTHEDLRTTFLAFALLAVISVHALFAGLGLGVETTINQVWPTLIAIIAHKGVEAFVVGSAFLKSTLGSRVVGFLLLMFASVTPIGIGIGMIVAELSDDVEIVSGCLVSVAAGSFLYVGTLVLKEDDHVGECIPPKMHNFKRFMFWCVGFALLAVAAIWC